MGHFEYQVILFSLTSTPAVFQAMCFETWSTTKFLSYLDYILMFSRNLEHVQDVCQVFHPLLCKFHSEIVSWPSAFLNDYSKLTLLRPKLSLTWQSLQPKNPVFSQLHKFLLLRFINNYKLQSDSFSSHSPHISFHTFHLDPGNRLNWNPSLSNHQSS